MDAIVVGGFGNDVAVGGNSGGGGVVGVVVGGVKFGVIDGDGCAAASQVAFIEVAAPVTAHVAQVPNAPSAHAAVAALPFALQWASPKEIQVQHLRQCRASRG